MTSPSAAAPTAGMRAPSLETIGMSKSFGALRALQDVSIQVPSGSFHALLGENGAGKSTLVKCIMGFYIPDRGQLRLDQAAPGSRSFSCTDAVPGSARQTRFGDGGGRKAEARNPQAALP
jgi:ABC-type branched-subunit amino acid transport system ATPase component